MSVEKKKYTGAHPGIVELHPPFSHPVEPFPWDELKTLVEDQVAHYTSEPKEVELGNGMTAKSQYQEFIFPCALEGMALHLATTIWDEGASMATPARSTHLIKDEEMGTVSVQRFSSWAGPIAFDVE